MFMVLLNDTIKYSITMSLVAPFSKLKNIALQVLHAKVYVLLHCDFWYTSTQL